MTRRILITGASGNLGRVLVADLLARSAGTTIIALDRVAVPEPLDRVERFVHDVREDFKALVGGYERFDAIVHLAYPLQHPRTRLEMMSHAVDASARVLEVAEATGTPKVVMLSSTTIYGARPGCPRLFCEEDAAQPNPDYLYAVGKLEMERLCRAWARAHPDVDVVVVRPCIVLYDGTSNYFVDSAAEIGELIGDCDPRMQFLDASDFAGAIAALLVPGRRGVFNVAPSDPGIPRSEMNQLVGLGSARIDRRRLVDRLRVSWERGGVISPAIVDYLSHEWLASNEKLRRSSDWTPRYGSVDTLLRFMAGVRRRARRARRSA